MDAYLTLADKLTKEDLVEREIGQRMTKSVKPRVISLPEGFAGAQEGLFVEGTIITLISLGDGSEYLDGIAGSINAKKETRLQLHGEAIFERIRKSMRRAPTAKGLDDMPLITDVLYGNTWLAKHVLISPQTTIAMSTSIWSGGELNDQNFRVLVHEREKSKMKEIQVLVVLAPPKLTKVERAVLKAVSKDLSEVHIKGPSVAWSAAGLSVQVTPEKKAGQAKQSMVDVERIFVPFYEKHVNATTVDQRQVQQQNTQQQQQQQQQQDTKHQQQQQQQQDADKNQQQQQQEQHQDNNTNQQQNEQQQQQDQNTNQQQHAHENAHQANTNQQQGTKNIWDDDHDGGLVIHPMDRERYASLLSKIDFESLDATQSVKELLRLREQLLTVGLG